MVFCGPPSKGCAKCRQRRIKCDQAVPHCSQCLRTSKICGGYRDQLDLCFRDETEKVLSKVKAPKHPPRLWQSSQPSKASRKCQKRSLPATSRSVSRTQSSPESDSHSVVYHSLPATIESPLNPVDDLGVRFFLSHYMTILTARSDTSSVFATNAFWPQLYANPSFYSGVSSAGYAGLANVSKDGNYMVMARKQYARTVRMINKALRNPVGSDLQSVLRSTLVLVAFEMVMNCTTTGHGATGAWSIHLEGAAALLKSMQGNRFDVIPVRQQLQFCFLMFAKFVGNNQPCSRPVLEWYRSCAEQLSLVDTPATTLADIMIRFLDLNARVGSKTFSDYESILDVANALESEMELWEAGLPEGWRFIITPMTPENLNESGHGELHSYVDLWISRMWNHYRWARILLNELRLSYIIKHRLRSSDGELLAQSCLYTIAEMSKGIFCSISDEFLSRHNLKSTMGSRGPVISGIFHILYPLSIATGCMGVPKAVYDSGITRLEDIAQKLGLHQTFTAIERAKTNRARWKTACHEAGSGTGIESECEDLRNLSQSICNTRKVQGYPGNEYLRV